MHDIQLDTLPRSGDKITIAQAYEAILRLVGYYKSIGGSVDEMLVEMSSEYSIDDKPNDPGAWSLWLDCVDGCTPLGGDGCGQEKTGG